MQETIEIASCRLQHSSELSVRQIKIQNFDLININKKLRVVVTGRGGEVKDFPIPRRNNKI